MNFDEYDKQAGVTAVYPESGEGTPMSLSYAALGLTGESGEVAEKVKKLIRDRGGVVDDDFRAAVSKELGDVLWYLSALAREVGTDLGTVAELNIAKLRSRAERSKIQGEGDDR